MRLYVICYGSIGDWWFQRLDRGYGLSIITLAIASFASIVSFFSRFLFIRTLQYVLLAELNCCLWHCQIVFCWSSILSSSGIASKPIEFRKRLNFFFLTPIWRKTLLWKASWFNENILESIVSDEANKRNSDSRNYFRDFDSFAKKIQILDNEKRVESDRDRIEIDQIEIQTIDVIPEISNFPSGTRCHNNINWPRKVERGWLCFSSLLDYSLPRDPGETETFLLTCS